MKSNTILQGKGICFIKKYFLIAVFIGSSVLIIYSLASIFVHLQSYQASAKKYQQVEKVYTEVQQKDSVSPIEKLQQINDETVGWLEIADTTINYPVVQADDNRFYLDHNFYKEEDFVGAIFMDYRNKTDQLDSNTIIYGHNMKDGSMFGNLKNYLDEDYYEKNRVIDFHFLGNTYKWEIFAAYKSLDTDWLQTAFQSEQSYQQYITARQQTSVIESQVEVDQDDKLLTLSTCTNGDERERFIVHAKLIKGENEIEEN